MTARSVRDSTNQFFSSSGNTENNYPVVVLYLRHEHEYSEHVGSEPQRINLGEEVLPMC